MKLLPVLIFILTFSLFAEKKDDKHLESRIYFYKNVSEEKLEGWEKEFFKDYFEDQPMSVPDVDTSTDNEVNDIDIIVKGIKLKKRRKPIRSGQIKKIVPEITPVKEIENEIPDEVEGDPDVEEIEKPKKKIKKPVKKKTVSLDEIVPETPEKDFETPDNEVDRSSRIRKMKKLLKKRKGKRRIDKRF